MRSYVLQSNTLLCVGESRAEKVKIIFAQKNHKMVKISVDFPQTLMSLRQIQEKMCPKVLVKRGCWEKSVEKSLVASRLVCWVTFLVVITKMIVFWSCTVSIRASEAVYSSKHQILKFLACRNGRWRNSEIFKILEKVITGAMQCPPCVRSKRRCDRRFW